MNLELFKFQFQIIQSFWLIQASMIQLEHISVSIITGFDVSKIRKMNKTKSMQTTSEMVKK